MKNTTSAIYLVKAGPAEYKVFSPNGKLQGSFEMDIDGFYKFWPTNEPGYWTEYNLKDLGKALEKLNEPWRKEIQEAMGTEDD